MAKQIKTTAPKTPLVKVESLPGGTLVRWSGDDEVFVVVGFKRNSAGIGAIGIEGGGYLSVNTLVSVLPDAEEVTFSNKVNG